MPSFPDDARNPLADDCRRCPELAEARECIAWGNGPLDASVVVVGEAPAAGDPEADRWRGGNLTGMAYTSRRSGRKVRSLCADAGLTVAEDCYFTNAVKCFPEGDDGDDRDPTATELANCRPYLREEIEQVDPDVLLTTGKHATNSVLAVDGRECDAFLDAVLDERSCPTLEATAVPLLHPSYQEVWLARLEYTYEEYVATLRHRLMGLDVL